MAEHPSGKWRRLTGKLILQRLTPERRSVDGYRVRPQTRTVRTIVMTVDWCPSALGVTSSELDAAPPTAATDAVGTAAERLLPWCLQAWPDAGGKAIATVERLDLQVRPDTGDGATATAERLLPCDLQARPDACDQPVRD